LPTSSSFALQSRVLKRSLLLVWGDFELHLREEAEMLCVVFFLASACARSMTSARRVRRLGLRSLGWQSRLRGQVNTCLICVPLVVVSASPLPFSANCHQRRFVYLRCRLLLAAFRGILFRLSNRIQFDAFPPKASTHSTMLPALADRGSFSKPMMHLVDVPGSVGQLASSSAFRSLWVVVCNPKSPRSQRSHIEEAGRRQMGPPTSS